MRGRPRAFGTFGACRHPSTTGHDSFEAPGTSGGSRHTCCSSKAMKSTKSRRSSRVSRYLQPSTAPSTAGFCTLMERIGHPLRRASRRFTTTTWCRSHILRRPRSCANSAMFCTWPSTRCSPFHLKTVRKAIASCRSRLATRSGTAWRAARVPQCTRPNTRIDSSRHGACLRHVPSARRTSVCAFWNGERTGIPRWASAAADFTPRSRGAWRHSRWRPTRAYKEPTRTTISAPRHYPSSARSRSCNGITSRSRTTRWPRWHSERTSRAAATRALSTQRGSTMNSCSSRALVR